MPKPSLSNLMQALRTAEKSRPSAAPTAQADPASPPDTVPPETGAVGSGPVGAADPLQAAAPIVLPPRPKNETTQKQLRALQVRQFVTALLSPANRYNAANAYRAISPNCSAASARTLALRMLTCEDVMEELDRQLKGIDASADMNEEWVYRQWRAIANADVFSMLNISKDGECTGFQHHPDDWPKELRLTVKKISFHPNGRIRDLQIMDRDKAVENVARARRMFVYDDSGTAVTDMAALITQRMRAAAKRTGRTFDGMTGEEVPES